MADVIYLCQMPLLSLTGRVILIAPYMQLKCILMSSNNLLLKNLLIKMHILAVGAQGLQNQ